MARLKSLEGKHIECHAKIFTYGMYFFEIKTWQFIVITGNYG